MAKRNQSVFEDIVHITAMAPWWVGVVLAIVSYFLLHPIATAVLPSPITIREAGAESIIGMHLWKALATVGQYVLPLMFLIGSGFSAAQRWKRRKLHADMEVAAWPQALQYINWKEFEALVGEAFRHQGYSVTETGGGGADEGVDLVLSRGTDKYLVQCKQWRATKVGVSTVRELYGVMAANGVAGGFVVTSGVFTDEAKNFAAGGNIELIDGVKLTGMIVENGKRQTYSSIQVSAKQSATPITPVCPDCGGAMIKRTAKKGANAGNEFWGCVSFPRCRGVRSV